MAGALVFLAGTRLSTPICHVLMGYGAARNGALLDRGSFAWIGGSRISPTGKKHGFW